MALVPPVQIVLVRNGDGGIFAFFDDENEAGRITKGQRAQKNGVDHAEDGGVRADAQRQCEDGDRRKARTLRQETEGIADVMEQCEHDFSPGSDTLPALTDAGRDSFGVAPPPGWLPN